MGKITKQVTQIDDVNQDIFEMQTDLQTQEDTWHKAEAKLQQENDELRARITDLQNKLNLGAGIDEELAKAQEAFDAANQTRVSTMLQGDNNRKNAEIQHDFWTQRKTDLEAHVRALNQSAWDELRQAEAQQLQIQTDAVALRLRASELKRRIVDTKKMMQLEQGQSDAKTNDLKRQLSEMNEGLARLETTLNQGASERMEERNTESPLLKKQLDSETAELIRLQQVHNEISADCNIKRRQREEVLCIEQGRASARHTEKVQFCGPVQMQHSVLAQWLSECQGKPLVPSPYRGIQSAPSGEVPSGLKVEGLPSGLTAPTFLAKAWNIRS
jgi:chromosome segregation ATPase